MAWLRANLCERLLELAEDIRSTDPCGAMLLKQAVATLRRGDCANCQNAYSRGYSAGLKKGRTEWEEGLPALLES